MRQGRERELEVGTISFVFAERFGDDALELAVAWREVDRAWTRLERLMKVGEASVREDSWASDLLDRGKDQV